MAKAARAHDTSGAHGHGRDGTDTRTLPEVPIEPGAPLTAEMLALILDSVQDGVTVYDRHGTLVWVNDRGCKMHGLTRHELLGRNVSEMATLPTAQSIVTSDIGSQSAEELRRTFRGIDRWRSPGYMRFRDGQRMFYTGTFIENRQGECEYAVYTLREVTDVEKARSQIAELRWKASLYEEQLHALHHHALGQDMVAASDMMRNVLERALRIARLDSNVLILGETGVGKTLLARYIHVTSRRHQGPFVHVNCASLPESIIEAELFGHAGGAFTGATRDGRSGLIEQGQGGTVFLDEISEMSSEMQARLLTVIEDKMLRRVGDEQWRSLDVRFVAATNCAPEQVTSASNLRQDLYYRLAMNTVHVPPLRERPADVPPLAMLAVDEFNAMNGSMLTLDSHVTEQLQSLRLSGNTRELRSIIWEMGASAQSDEAVLTTAQLSAALARNPTLSGHSIPSGKLHSRAGKGDASAAEAGELRKLCETHDGDVYAVAEVLGVHRTTVVRKCRRYGIPYARRRRQPAAT